MTVFRGITKLVGSFTVKASGYGHPTWIEIQRGNETIASTLCVEDLRDLRYAIDRTISEIEKYEAER